MISSSSHPSSTSVDSATGLTAAYRPPQKDYAAAYAALHEKYGSFAHGQTVPKPTEITGPSKSATPPRSSSRPQPSESTASPATPPTTESRVQAAMKRLRAMLRSVFGFGSGGKITSLWLFCDLTHV
ncbi:hypothetical protein B0H19DRAFT_1058784 [Mycena capillaripes]|nr:hypothetical protein B0H19DRAFT_1058784 [Mycena capillaripes]